MKIEDIVNKDTLSSLAKRATDILFVMNPKGTSVGVVFGVVLDGLVKILEPTLKKQQVADFSKANPVYFVFFGILLFNLPSALRRQRLDPQVEAALRSIRKAQRDGDVTKVQARLMYLNLYEKVLAQITLDTPTNDQVNAVQRAANNTDVTPRP